MISISKNCINVGIIAIGYSTNFNDVVKKLYYLLSNNQMLLCEKVRDIKFADKENF